MSNLLPGLVTTAAVTTAYGVYQAAKTVYGHTMPQNPPNKQNISDQQLKKLIALFKLSDHIHINIGAWIISQYEQQCIEQTKNISPHDFVQNIKIPSKITETTSYNTKYIKLMLINYIDLHSSIYKPLSIKSNVRICNVYNINIIISYITHLSMTIYGLYKKQQNEVQFNIKFVPHSFEYLLPSNEAQYFKSDNISRNRNDKTIFDELDEMINCPDIGSFGCYINITIIRKNEDNMDEDIIYLSTKSKAIRNDLYEYDPLINKIHSIPKTDGILTFSYDLCPYFERTYIYFGGFGTRLFKHNILKVLGLLFGVDIRSQIDGQVVAEFNAKYKQLTDLQNIKCSELFGINNKRKNDEKNDEKKEDAVDYKICDEYILSEKIIFIPKKYTEKAIKNNYILERFENKEQLFYYLRWRCVMDAANHNLIIFNGNFNGIGEILIFCTDLHEKNGGKPIYVIGNRNDKEISKKLNGNKKSIERWKMSEYFINAMEIEKKYDINSNDLPFGSNKILKRIYKKMDIDKLINIKNNISIKKYMNLPIIKTNKAKSNNTSRKYTISECDLSVEIKKWNGFIPIISFIDDNKVKYNVDMVLLIDIGNNNWIGIIFRYNNGDNGDNINYEPIGIAIDCTDLRNKIILYQPPHNDKQYKWIENDNISGLNIINNNKDEIIADLIKEIQRLKQHNDKLCDQNNYYFLQTLNPNCNIKPHPLHLPYSIQPSIPYNAIINNLCNNNNNNNN